MQAKFGIKTPLRINQLKDYKEFKPDIVNFSVITFLGESFKVNIQKELKIDESDLISSMVEHAGIFGWWASLHATAKKLLRDVKLENEKTRDALDSEARASLKENEIRVTEEGVRAWLNSDPRTSHFITESKVLEDLVEYSGLIMKALEHKRDMLKEINRAQLKENFNEKI